MSDIILEIIRALVVSVIFIYLWIVGGKEEIRRQDGWLFILTGFGLILFGMLIDITDNFSILNKYIVIGDTAYQAFLEKVVGYLIGFILLAVGFWKWMPTVVRLRETEKELKESHDELELRVKERTTELEIEISERKQAEVALRESEARFRAIFEDAAIGIALVNMKGQPFESNPALQEIFGYSREEFSNMVFTDFTHPDDVKKDWSLFQELIDGKRDHYQMEKRYFKKNGQIVWGHLTVSLVRGDQGEPLFAIGMAENVTERKLAEEALRQSNERIETLLFSLPIGVVIIDSESHKIVDANPLAILMIGSPLEQIVGLKYHQFICAAEEGKCPITNLGQTIDKSERVLLTASGEKIPILKSVIPFTIDDQKLFVECFIDITEHKLAEQERITREKLEGVIEMAGAVCHELNQPMQAVSGYSELLMMGIKDDSPLFDKVSRIKKQVDRIGDITKKLMGITKYETKSYIDGKIIDINKAIDCSE